MYKVNVLSDTGNMSVISGFYYCHQCSSEKLNTQDYITFPNQSIAAMALGHRVLRRPEIGGMDIDHIIEGANIYTDNEQKSQISEYEQFNDGYLDHKHSKFSTNFKDNNTNSFARSIFITCSDCGAILSHTFRNYGFELTGDNSIKISRMPFAAANKVQNHSTSAMSMLSVQVKSIKQHIKYNARETLKSNNISLLDMFFPGYAVRNHLDSICDGKIIQTAIKLHIPNALRDANPEQVLNDLKAAAKNINNARNVLFMAYEGVYYDPYNNRYIYDLDDEPLNEDESDALVFANAPQTHVVDDNACKANGQSDIEEKSMLREAMVQANRCQGLITQVLFFDLDNEEQYNDFYNNYVVLAPGYKEHEADRRKNKSIGMYMRYAKV